MAVKAGGRAGVGFPQGAERAPTPSRAAVVPLHMSPSLFSLTVPLCCAPSPRTRENTEKPHQHPQGHAEARQVRPEPPPPRGSSSPILLRGVPPRARCSQQAAVARTGTRAWHRGPLHSVGAAAPSLLRGVPLRAQLFPAGGRDQAQGLTPRGSSSSGSAQGMLGAWCIWRREGLLRKARVNGSCVSLGYEYLLCACVLHSSPHAPLKMDREHLG